MERISWPAEQRVLHNRVLSQNVFLVDDYEYMTMDGS